MLQQLVTGRQRTKCGVYKCPPPLWCHFKMFAQPRMHVFCLGAVLGDALQLCEKTGCTKNECTRDPQNCCYCLLYMPCERRVRTCQLLSQIPVEILCFALGVIRSAGPLEACSRH